MLKINGIRFSLEDGSWGLIRASSNKPSLVVVAESLTSDERKNKIFKFIDDTFTIKLEKLETMIKKFKKKNIHKNNLHDTIKRKKPSIVFRLVCLSTL